VLAIRGVALAATLLLFAGGSDAADRSTAQCMRTARTEMSQCLRDAQERCETQFRDGLGGCFQGSASTCLTGCLRTDERCREEPQETKQGCRLACTADQKVLLRGCKVEPDMATCQAAAKKKTTECRQECAKTAGPNLRACKDRFAACLEQCARAADAEAAPAASPAKPAPSGR
jgi:hypothetical protein